MPPAHPKFESEDTTPLNVTGQMNCAATCTGTKFENGPPGQRINFVPSEEDSRTFIGEADEGTFGCPNEQVVPGRQYWVATVVMCSTAQFDQRI